MAVRHLSTLSPRKLHITLNNLPDSKLEEIVRDGQNNQGGSQGASSYMAALAALVVLERRNAHRRDADARSHGPNSETVADEVIAETGVGVSSLPVKPGVSSKEEAMALLGGINAARGAPTDTDRSMPKGVAGLPSPMTYAAQGGIVSFAGGGSTKEEESVPSTSVLNAAQKKREARRAQRILEKQEEDIEEYRLGPAIRRAAQRRDQEQHLKAIKERFPELYKILTEEKAQGGIVNLRSGGSLRWKEGLQPPDSIMDFWNRLLTYTGMGEDEEEEERKAGERAAGISPRATTGDLRREAERLGQLRSVIDEEAVPNTPPKKGRHPLFPATPGATPRWKEGLRLNQIASLLEEERKAGERAAGTSPRATTGDLRREAERLKQLRSVIEGAGEAVSDTPPKKGRPTGPQKSGIARAAELLRKSKKAEREAGRRAGIPVPEEAGGPVLDASSGATSDATPLSALNPNDPRLSLINRAVELFKPDQQQRVQQEAQAARLRELKERTEIPVPEEDPFLDVLKSSPVTIGDLRRGAKKTARARTEKRNTTNAEAEAARARELKPKAPVAGARAEVGAKKATEQTTQTKQDYTEQDYSDINKLVGKGAERLDSLSDEEQKSLQTTAEAKGISPIRLALILGGLKLMSGDSLGDAAEKAVAAYAAAEKYQYDRSAKAYEKARLAEDRRRTAEYREQTIKLRKEEAKNRQARAEATEEGRRARAEAIAKYRAETSARQEEALKLRKGAARRERAEEVVAGGALEDTFEEAAWRQIYRKFHRSTPEKLRREKALENSVPGLVSAMKREYIRTGRLPDDPDPIKSIQLLPQRMP